MRKQVVLLLLTCSVTFNRMQIKERKIEKGKNATWNVQKHNKNEKISKSRAFGRFYKCCTYISQVIVQ